MPSLDDLEFALWDNEKMKKQTNPKAGPSPYYEKYTEGPSYVSPENRPAPLKLTGALDKKYGQYGSEVTPLLGREYSSEVQISDILKDEEALRDLAVTIARRGVVTFRNQDLTVQEQKDFVQRLGVLSGKPKTSGLHIHPVTPAGGILGEDGLIDPEVSFIASKIQRNYHKKEENSQRASFDWHSDITFEPVPADFTSLKIIDLPASGGDTMFANGYALYEKFSPSFRAYLETLTGTYSQNVFGNLGESKSFDLYSQERGAPENVGNELIAVHPIVRTNPITGWKSVFAVGNHFTKINEVSPIESELLRKFIFDTLISSHDIQLRFKWNKNDVAVWDNRSVYHGATFDYLKFADRVGIRTVSIAERPYLDPNSTTQTEEVLKELADLEIAK